MRIAILTTDNRDHQRSYAETVPRFGPAIESVLDGLSRIPELELHVVACTQRPMAAPEKLSANTWFHLLHVPKWGWLRTGYQGCIRAIRRKLCELKPDLVHGQGTERECALSAVLSGFPSIVTVHGNVAEVARSARAPVGSFLWCASYPEAFALRRADAVFCNSAYTERIVGRYNSKTWRVPNALRREFFDRPLPERVTPACPILLNVGVVTSFKRQLSLLAVAKKLHADGLRFEMRFVGAADPSQSYAGRFLAEVGEAETAGYASYIPPRSLPELIGLYDSAAALVHAPAEEAFGLVVAEALSRDLKLFGTRTGGMPDIAEGVEGAELFPPDDESALKAAIDRWLRAGAERPFDSATIMRQRYHPDVIAARHVEIYRQLLQG